MSECVLCVDIGGTSTKIAVLDRANELRCMRVFPTKPPVDEYILSLLTFMSESAREAEDYGLASTGIGVAIAGFLTPERERLLYNPNTAWLEGYPLRDRIMEKFELRVDLESDSNSACMAEQRFGCGRNSKRFLCLTAGTGLGVGMTVNGEPLRLVYGCLGDIGHVIVQPGGVLCSCGGRGCAEALISAPRLAQLWKERTETAGEISLRDVIEAARSHNSDAIAVLREAGEHLGIAIASIANTLFPDVIAVAGGFSAAGEFVMRPAEQVFRESASILARENVVFARATLGSQAPLIGAAWPFWRANGESITG